MNCREFTEFLSAYLSGELPESERKVFDDHLRLCPPCVDYLADYKDVIDQGKCACRDEDETARKSPPEDLVRAILAAREKHS